MSWKKQRTIKVSTDPDDLEAYCSLCNEYIANTKFRRFLWSDSARIRRIIEHVLQVRITMSDDAQLICFSCLTQVRNISRDVHRIRDEINTMVRNLVAHGTAARLRPEEKRGGIAKRIELTLTELPVNLCKWRREIDSMLCHLSGDGGVLPSSTEKAGRDDEPEQAGTPTPLDSAEDLGSSAPPQSVSPTRSSDTAGGLGTATPGDLGTATPGDLGTSTPGDLGTSTPGDLGTSTPGDLGTSTATDLKTSTPGDLGTSTPGDLGTSTPGDLGTSTPENLGPSTPEDLGPSTLEEFWMSTQVKLERTTPVDFDRTTTGDLGTATPGDLGTPTQRDLGISTPVKLEETASGALGVSTQEDAGTSTPDSGTSTQGASETSTVRRSKRLSQVGTKPWSLIASGKLYSKVSRRSSSKASAISSPKASEAASPKASGMSSTKATRMSPTKAIGRTFTISSDNPVPMALWRSAAAGKGKSSVYTEHDYVECTSQSSLSGDGSTYVGHKVCDAAAGDVQVSAYFHPEHHSYCQTGAPDNDVRIIVEIRPDDTSTNAVLQDGLTPMDCQYGELTGIYDWGDNTHIQTDVRTNETRGGPQYLVPEVQRVYTVREEDGSERYVDVRPEDETAEVTFPLVRKRKVKRLWKCPLCRLVFASRNVYVHHARRVHPGQSGEPVRRYLCGTCGRSFEQLSALVQHERVHTGERPFACRTCDKTYRLRYALKVHERKHRGEKPYLCAECGKSFVCNSSMRQHEKQHVTALTHVCPTCSKAFNCAQALTRHRKIHDGIRPFVCGVCGYAFETRYHLMRHGRARHPVAWADAEAAKNISVSSA